MISYSQDIPRARDSLGSYVQGCDTWEKNVSGLLLRFSHPQLAERWRGCGRAHSAQGELPGFVVLGPTVTFTVEEVVSPCLCRNSRVSQGLFPHLKVLVTPGLQRS